MMWIEDCGAARMRCWCISGMMPWCEGGGWPGGVFLIPGGVDLWDMERWEEWEEWPGPTIPPFGGGGETIW